MNKSVGFVERTAVNECWTCLDVQTIRNVNPVGFLLFQKVVKILNELLKWNKEMWQLVNEVNYPSFFWQM